jgi:phage protein D
MRLKPIYHIMIGTHEIDSKKDVSTSTLVHLNITRDLDAHTDQFELHLAPLGGIQPNRGEDVTLELGFDDKYTRVFTGKVTDVLPEVTKTRVIGLSTVLALEELRVNKTYEGKNAGEIAKDLASQASVKTGVIEDGIRWLAYVIDGRISAARHIARMAERCGFDAYLLPTGELEFRKFTKSAPDQTFTYGEDILDYRLVVRPETAKTVTVYGDSPASAKGDVAASWLTKNFKVGTASGGDGQQSVLIEDPAIRTQEGANLRAEGVLRRLRQRTVTGWLRVLGRPEVRLGDAISVEKAPDERLNKVFQVRSVRHRLDRKVGLITEIDFWSIP